MIGRLGDVNLIGINIGPFRQAGSVRQINEFGRGQELRITLRGRMKDFMRRMNAFSRWIESRCQALAFHLFSAALAKCLKRRGKGGRRS